MSTWQVTTPAGNITVEAHSASTTPSGALVFSNAQGGLVQAFAAGHWNTCSMTTPGQQGYPVHG